MPVKMRRAKAREFRITQRAVEAYRAGDMQALHLELGIRPWWPSPLDVDDEPAPAHWDADDWAMMQELRRELEAAAR